MAAHTALFGLFAIAGDDDPSRHARTRPADLELITIEVADVPSPPPAVSPATPPRPPPVADPAPTPVAPSSLPAPPATALRRARGPTRRPSPVKVAVATTVPPAMTDPREPVPTARPAPDIAPSRDPVMHMRTHRRPSVSPELPTAPGGFDVRRAVRAIVPKPTPPTVSMLTPALPGKEPDTGLRPTGGGTKHYDDITFDGHVSADGRVTFRDKPNLRAHIALPGARDIGRHITAWYRDPKGVATRDERAVKTRTIPIVGGSFDLTDWAMRAAGMDPYARRKAQMLDRTRPERFAMSAKWRSEVLRDSVAQLPDYLDRIWRYTAWSAAKRRRILFELWDESDEHGDSSRSRSGRAARATIIAFIRKRLPAGDPAAYPTRELEILNARRKSHGRFAPYRAGTTP